MGNVSSTPLTTLKIGRSSIAISGVLSLYNLQDNTTYYNNSKQLEVPPGILLKVRINQIYKILNSNLGLAKTKSYVSLAQLNVYDTCQNPIKLAIKMLVKGKKNKELVYDKLKHKNQLIICKENIFEIYEDIGKLTNLVFLQFCCNYITKIPFSIGNLQKLKSLVLYRNQLRRVPEEIGDLVNLINLDLSYNFIKDLPLNFANLKNLSNFNLESNCLKDVPICIKNMKCLKSLNLKNNLLKSVPLNILKMPFLMDFLVDLPEISKTEKICKIGEMTLKEVCARKIVLKSLRIFKNIDRPLINYLINVEECGFCGGPLFESYHTVDTIEHWEGIQIPVTYKLCTLHYTKHSERIKNLFSEQNKKVPYDLLLKKHLSVGEVFIKKIQRPKKTQYFSRKMDLRELNKYNIRTVDRDLLRPVDRIFFKDGSR